MERTFFYLVPSVMTHLWHASFLSLFFNLIVLSYYWSRTEGAEQNLAFPTISPNNLGGKITLIQLKQSCQLFHKHTCLHQTVVWLKIRIFLSWYVKAERSVCCRCFLPWPCVCSLLFFSEHPPPACFPMFYLNSVCAFHQLWHKAWSCAAVSSFLTDGMFSLLNWLILAGGCDWTVIVNAPYAAICCTDWGRGQVHLRAWSGKMKHS